MIISSVHGLLKRGNEILLLERYNTGYYDGYFTLPGGHVNPGESMGHALQREMYEEVGISIDLNATAILACTERVERNQSRIDFFFSIAQWQGIPFNNEPDKAALLNWYTMLSLPPKIVPHIEAFLASLNGMNQTGNGAINIYSF